MKTVPVLGRVDEPLADALKDEAAHERRSVSAQLNVILAQRYTNGDTP